MASHLSVTIPASPNLAPWLGFLSTAELPDGFQDPHQPSGTPQLKLHERLFDQAMVMFEAGESLWMAARFQIWGFGNLLAAGLLNEGGYRFYLQAASYTTSDVNTHEVVLCKGGQVVATYPELTYPARATISRRITSMAHLLKLHLGAHLSSIGHSRSTQGPPLQPPPPQSSSPPDP